jgi:hypothetical protein
MKCPCCNKELEAAVMDLSFGLPDAIYNLPAEQRAVRAQVHSDLCCLDDARYFIRGVVFVPIPQMNAEFRWGVWAEVSAETHDRYLDLYHVDGSAEAPAAGVLANVPPGYDAAPQPLEIHFGALGKRPAFKLTPTEGQMYREQANGMEASKWHSIIEGRIA